MEQRFVSALIATGIFILSFGLTIVGFFTANILLQIVGMAAIAISLSGLFAALARPREYVYTRNKILEADYNITPPAFRAPAAPVYGWAGGYGAWSAGGPWTDAAGISPRGFATFKPRAEIVSEYGEYQTQPTMRPIVPAPAYAPTLRTAAYTNAPVYSNVPSYGNVGYSPQYETTQSGPMMAY